MPTFVCNGTNTGTGTLQQYTVPITGPYRIRAVGGQGGHATNSTGLGGKGADMAGDFNLTAGEVINIMVGQQPTYASGTVGSGNGGGGSFVVKQVGNIPLVVAGGGHGATGSTHGIDARTTYTNSNGSTSAAGGAGFSSNGSGDSWVSSPPYAYLNDGRGGGPGSYSNYGGYGGGGATHGNNGTSNVGGGGYQGGDSNNALGAGSYNAGTNQTNAVSTGTGNGFVEITLLNEFPLAPTGLSVQNGMYVVRRAKASWTHSDPDGDPQSKYQLRWRVTL